MTHGHGNSAALVALLLAGAYLLLVARARQGWGRPQTASFLTGCALLGLGLSPHLMPWPEGDFRAHMMQHLLIGMLAPLALVLGAPMTLLLRAVPAHTGRRISAALRSRAAKALSHPVTALTLNVGGMGLLYFTPLYAEATERPMVHALIHVHFLAAGCLFAWVIAGPDPAPHRPSVPVRLVVLGVAIAAHAVLAQLMYAGLFVQVPAPPEQLRGAGELMYYGGDIAELLLALALLTTWRPRPRATAVQAP